MDKSIYCTSCYNRWSCKKSSNINTVDTKLSCYVYCKYDELNSDNLGIDCSRCHKKYNMKYNYCCLNECGEHEFCRGCYKGIYENKQQNQY